MTLTMIPPDLDICMPAGRNGTLRGTAPAFVIGFAALRTYWRDDTLEQATLAREQPMTSAPSVSADPVPGVHISSRGRSVAHGLAFEYGELAGKVSSAAFERGVLIETARPEDEVVKLLRPLTMSDDSVSDLHWSERSLSAATLHDASGLSKAPNCGHLISAAAYVPRINYATKVGPAARIAVTDLLSSSGLGAATSICILPSQAAAFRHTGDVQRQNQLANFVRPATAARMDV